MHVRCAAPSRRAGSRQSWCSTCSVSSTVGRRASIVAAIAVGLVAVTGWVTSADYRGIVPGGDYVPRRIESLTLTGSDAAARRLDALARATFDAPLDAAAAYPQENDPLARPVPACRFLPSEPSGTTAKFDCVFEGGDVVKVKYGRNSEIHAEAAATRLINMLGYASDTVTIVPRLRCYGCPRYPFLVERLKSWFDIPLVQQDPSSGYTDFEWVAVERKFPKPAIETDTLKGWSWWELDSLPDPRGDIDAFRLTAMLLAHWDNKGENQRLVCLDEAPSPDGTCARPLAMMQDLGASFGPLKVNLARWRDLPVWQDRNACLVSMRALPFEGATFGDTVISEAGRLQFAARVGAITDAAIERLFAEARFPQFQAGTDDEGDLKAWTDAFRHRRDQIVNGGPCPSWLPTT
jgi:hypothetical protein